MYSESVARASRFFGPHTRQLGTTRDRSVLAPSGAVCRNDAVHLCPLASISGQERCDCCLIIRMSPDSDQRFRRARAGELACANTSGEMVDTMKRYLSVVTRYRLTCIKHSFTGELLGNQYSADRWTHPPIRALTAQAQQHADGPGCASFRTWHACRGVNRSVSARAYDVLFDETLQQNPPHAPPHLTKITSEKDGCAPARVRHASSAE